MDKFLEYVLYALMFLTIGFLILWLVGGMVMFDHSRRLVRFVRDNQYGVVIQAETVPRVRMVKRGFTASRDYIVMLRGADTGEECPFRISKTQFNEIGLSDTILLDTLMLN